jgi:hypothetical protein
MADGLEKDSLQARVLHPVIPSKARMGEEAKNSASLLSAEYGIVAQ